MSVSPKTCFEALALYQDAAHKPADVADPQASRVQCRLTMAVPLPFYPLYE